MGPCRNKALHDRHVRGLYGGTSTCGHANDRTANCWQLTERECSSPQTARSRTAARAASLSSISHLCHATAARGCGLATCTGPRPDRGHADTPPDPHPGALDHSERTVEKCGSIQATGSQLAWDPIHTQDAPNNSACVMRDRESTPWRRRCVVGSRSNGQERRLQPMKAVTRCEAAVQSASPWDPSMTTSW